MPVFNMLMDMRHLIIVDFRVNDEETKEDTMYRIRYSIVATLDNYRELVSKAVTGELCPSKLAFKSQYKEDILRRLLFIMPQNDLQKYIGNINSDLDQFTKEMGKLDPSGHQIAKVMYLKNFDTTFYSKYPLVCINHESPEPKQILAQTRFPSEIKRDNLFIGNAINVMKQYTQLWMLGIKSVVYFSPKQFEDVHKNGKFDTVIHH